VEWYQSEITDEELDAIAATLDESASSMRADGLAVQRLMTLAVPTDEMIFGVFVASSPDTVVQLCQHAGITAARLTAAVEDRFRRPNHGETPDSPRPVSP
jgi:hypothetical protein